MATQVINAVWALDFMHDTLYSGRTFRTLNVIDEADRGCLGIDLSTSILAARVIRFVEQLIEIHGKPAAIRCDNGPELTSYDFTEWCKAKDIALRFIPARQAGPERVHRALQPHLPRGGAQRLPVRLDRRGAGDHRRLAGPIQRNQAARRTGKPAASALPRASSCGGNSTLELST
jgi:transposase InsO family protein